MEKNQQPYLGKSASGFTLIEILVSIGVLSIIGGLAISIFISLNASYDKASIVNSISHEGNRVMELISRSIRNSIDAEQISSSHLRLTIPKEVGNLEYSNNGECMQVDIFIDSLSNELQKSSPSSTCEQTAICPDTDACVLSSDNIDIISMEFTVTDNPDTPDSVVIELTVRQDPSLGDPEQQAGQTFRKVVLTRGY